MIVEVIEDTFDSIQKVTGKSSFPLIMGGLALAFIVMYVIQSRSQSETDSVTLQGATSYASYPDSVTNADVIISTLQDNIAYEAEATNNYIREGLEKQQQMSDKLDTTENIAAMSYYEQMLDMTRQGFLHGGNEETAKTNALGALENAGFNTLRENGTTASGKLSGVPGSAGGGWTTFTGSNDKGANA